MKWCIITNHWRGHWRCLHRPCNTSCWCVPCQGGRGSPLWCTPQTGHHRYLPAILLHLSVGSERIIWFKSIVDSSGNCLISSNSKRRGGGLEGEADRESRANKFAITSCAVHLSDVEYIFDNPCTLSEINLPPIISAIELMRVRHLPQSDLWGNLNHNHTNFICSRLLCHGL